MREPAADRARGRYRFLYCSSLTFSSTVAAPAAETRAPHSRQNFAEGGSSVPQFEQVTARRAPHSRQNLA